MAKVPLRPPLSHQGSGMVYSQSFGTTSLHRGRSHVLEPYYFHHANPSAIPLTLIVCLRLLHIRLGEPPL